MAPRCPLCRARAHVHAAPPAAARCRHAAPGRPAPALPLAGGGRQSVAIGRWRRRRRRVRSEAAGERREMAAPGVAPPAAAGGAGRGGAGESSVSGAGIGETAQGASAPGGGRRKGEGVHRCRAPLSGQRRWGSAPPFGAGPVPPAVPPPRQDGRPRSARSPRAVDSPVARADRPCPELCGPRSPAGPAAAVPSAPLSARAGLRSELPPRGRRALLRPPRGSAGRGSAGRSARCSACSGRAQPSRNKGVLTFPASLRFFTALPALKASGSAAFLSGSLINRC